jgi:5'-nucleotidase
VPLILLTNDDGIDAEGLRALEKHVAGLAETLVVAPDRERSAVSHGLTIHAPLELNKVGPGRYTLNGTPADCVIYALKHLAAPLPDLVLSGINHGANLGDDIMYSGTVAAAREASRHGIPSVALSQAYDDRPIRFDAGARFIRQLIENLIRQKDRGGLCLNVNIPVRKVRGVRVTRQGCRTHFQHFTSGGDAAIAQQESALRNASVTLDYDAILNQYVSVTPLQRDQTDYDLVQVLMRDGDRLFDEFRPGMELNR